MHIYLQDISMQVSCKRSAQSPRLTNAATLDSTGLGSFGAFCKIRAFILILTPPVFDTVFQDIVHHGTLIPSANSFSTWEIIRLNSQSTNYSQSSRVVSDWSCCCEHDLLPSIKSYRNYKAEIYFYDFAFKLLEHHERCDCFSCSFYWDHRRKIIREET